MKFVPNVGKQYVAVVPSGNVNNINVNYDYYGGQSKQPAPIKPLYLAGNEVYDKHNGKYNAKLKKYKAYEQKAKMVPYVLVSTCDASHSMCVDYANVCVRCVAANKTLPALMCNT